MNEMGSFQLNHILNNKTLGSSELVKLLNDYFFSINKNIPEVCQTIKQVKSELGHFQAVNTYLSNLNSALNNKNRAALVNLFSMYSIQQSRAVEAIFNKIYPELKNLKKVITLSRSGTVIGILKLWHQENNKIKVIVCESRPMFEGRLIAKDLADHGIKVELITDAMMGLFIDKIDAAIIGADIVLKNGSIVNKVGSKALALLCKDKKKPIYVVTSRLKVSTKKLFKPKKENPTSVWDKEVKDISVSNIYFEKVEKKLITKIFTD